MNSKLEKQNQVISKDFYKTNRNNATFNFKEKETLCEINLLYYIEKYSGAVVVIQW